jgi:RimJ/RimL family protein N-acetyltransferase
MFARTERLLLRPGFPEDAAAIAAAIGNRQVARNLAAVPWPYGPGDASAFLAQTGDPLMPALVVTERTATGPEIVGGCSLRRRSSGAVEFGLWVAHRHWGRGIATEAGEAVLGIAKALKLESLEAFHFLDNFAGGRVLEKLGFVPTGFVAPRSSLARRQQAPARLMRLRLNRDEEVEPLAA